MMKLLKITLLVFVAFAASYSAAPAAWSAQDAVPEWGFNSKKAASSAVGLDTLVGTDSTTLWADLNPTRGYFSTIVRDAITGTGSDSVNLQVRVDCKDGVRGNILYSVVVDTMTSSAGEPIALDFGGALKGNRFDIKLVGLAGTGSQVIINRVLLDETRPVSYPKMWR
jgi:hypothetical protein